MKVSLATADIPFKAVLNLFECVKDRRIGRGKFVREMERRFEDYFHVPHAIAVSNGTMADYLMLRALSEKIPSRKEVIMPALTFVAQANAVVMAGLKPVFVDVNDDYQMDVEKAEAAITSDTLCMFPVHLIGKYSPTALEFHERLPVLEDCCEAMGGSKYGMPFGTFGEAGAFSMFPSHTITTGEGGLVITEDESLAEIMRSIMNHGKWGTDDFSFKYIGINSKMTNLQAAIGCELVSTIDEVNRKRTENVYTYNQILGMSFNAEAPHCYPIIYKTRDDRDRALIYLKSKGVECRKLMGCIPDYDFYISKFNYMDLDLPKARKFANNGLFLPIHQNLTKKEIAYVSEHVKSTLA